MTGYKGRAGLYEVMEMDDEMRELILIGASAVELKKKAIERGMITLRRSGLMKVKEGVTTLEEVARETCIKAAVGYWLLGLVKDPSSFGLKGKSKSN